MAPPGPTGMGEPIASPWGHGNPQHPSETRRSTLLGDLAPPPHCTGTPHPPGLHPCYATHAVLCHPCHAAPPAGRTRALLCSLTLPQANSFQTLLRQQAQLEVLARRVTLLEAIIWPGNRAAFPPPLPA